MTDLFDTPVLPGFDYRDDVITLGEEAELIRQVDAQALSPFRFQGWLGKRLTKSFGWMYDFDSGEFGATEPIPTWLLSLKNRVAAFSNVPNDDLVQALLTRYDPGAGIGWHRDRPVFANVVGVSLGTAAAMRFRRRKSNGFDRASALLAPRSVYHLDGEARRSWEHSITPIELTRWSITFRSFAKNPTDTAASRYQ